jgi:microcystin-dependent protein
MGIAQNDLLYNVLGTTYGGDGTTTFGIPDLRGRVPIHQGQGPNLSHYTIGQQGGAETVTLNVNQLPSHNHTAVGTVQGQSTTNPASATWGNGNNSQNIYGPNSQIAAASMNAAAIGFTGGNQSHDNMLPFLTFTFIIALYGRYPSQ